MQLIVFSVVLHYASAWGVTIYVDKSSAAPTPPFTNGFATAATTIQDAVDAETNFPGDGHRIIVKEGVYDTGFSVVDKGAGGSLTCRVDFTQIGLGDSELLYLESFNGPDVTTIKGIFGPSDFAVRCIHAVDRYGVHITGFTIEDGSCLTETFPNNDDLDRGGTHGGNYSNCVFSALRGGRHGAFWYDQNFRWEIVDCVFTNNEGGNGATGGGPDYRNCVFVDNLRVSRNNWVRNNYENCLFTDYDDMESGFNLQTFVNCTFAGNVLNNNDFCLGGATNESFPTPTIATNCVVYNDTSGGGANWHTNTVIIYTLTDPLPPGAGNIATNPLFVGTNGATYELTLASPAIDAGTSVTLTFDTDLNGLSRIFDDIIDMGAYENRDPRPKFGTIFNVQ